MQLKSQVYKNKKLCKKLRQILYAEKLFLMVYADLQLAYWNLDIVEYFNCKYKKTQLGTRLDKR